ncbi:MAG TPA: hypothetical protein VE907_16270 [Gammaproteobacteria bacterium]|nr:hypothetical protein [Gammaproteobacteria bacterium]
MNRHTWHAVVVSIGALSAGLLGGCGAGSEPAGAAQVTRAAASAASAGQVAARAPTSGSAKATELGFTGVWFPVGSFENPAGPAPWSNTPWPSDPPFTDWGRAETARLADHSNFVACSPVGPVYQMWEIGLFPIELLQAPDQIVILRESSILPRRIYTDGRGHPEDLDPSWMGHSIGTWEGDVLVVDTVGTNGKARAMNGVGSNARVSTGDRVPRMPASDRLHVIEHLRLVAAGEILEDEITIDDPKTYTQSFTVKHYFQKRPDLDVLEYYCDENPRESGDVAEQ